MRVARSSPLFRSSSAGAALYVAGLQDSIADGVAEGVVDPLEVVHVQHQERQLAPVTPSGLELDLELAPAVFPADRAWTLSAQRAGPGVFLDQGDGARSELSGGEILRVPGGFVRLEKLGMWMGYRVFYEPTLPWLFTTALLALAALTWWFWIRFARSPGSGVRPVIESESPA